MTYLVRSNFIDYYAGIGTWQLDLHKAFHIERYKFPNNYQSQKAVITNECLAKTRNVILHSLQLFSSGVSFKRWHTLSY